VIIVAESKDQNDLVAELLQIIRRQQEQIERLTNMLGEKKVPPNSSTRGENTAKKVVYLERKVSSYAEKLSMYRNALKSVVKFTFRQPSQASSIPPLAGFVILLTGSITFALLGNQAVSARLAEISYFMLGLVVLFQILEFIIRNGKKWRHDH
jgi:hypothetical protein